MSTLFPHLPFSVEETPISYAARLASYHIGARVGDFLKDIEVPADALASGDAEAIENLGRIACVDPDALRANATRPLAKRLFELRGHVLSAEFYNGSDAVFCPACLMEDDDAAGIEDVARTRRGRLDWTLQPVRTCARHDLALTRRRKQSGDGKYLELAFRVPERGADLHPLIDDAEQRGTSALQTYVLNRLRGERGPFWLDGQTLEQAVRTSEMLGMLAEFGPSARPSAMGDDDWDRAGRVGYEITSRGEEGIREALSDAQRAFRQTGKKLGRRKIFGATYEWLSSSRNAKEPGDVRRIMREHIFDTMEIAAGEPILGGRLTERRLHSVESLAAESGLDARTLRNLLAAGKLIPAGEEANGSHVFDAEAGRRLAASVRRMTHVSSLGKALNCTRPQAEQLLDERLLTPIIDAPASTAGQTRKAVDNLEIKGLIGSLHRRAYTVRDAPEGMVSVFKAAQKTRVLSSEIAHLVLGGFVTNVARLGNVEGYGSILVDPEEVRRQIPLCLTGLPACVALRSLKMPIETAWALARRKTGPRLDPVVVEGGDGTHRFWRFEQETIDRFMAAFVTSARIAMDHGVRAPALWHRLRSAGVRPVLSRQDVGVDIYRTADIPAPIPV